MKTTGYIILQGGRPCGLYNASATSSTKRGGCLIPGKPVEQFTQPRDAQRAIRRTERVAKALSGSLVDEWIKLSPLLSGEAYEIVPLVKQGQEEA